MKTQAATLAALGFLLGAAVPAADDVAGMKRLEAPEWTVPGIEMEMKRIPAGTFMMGSPKDEMCRRGDEVHHKVTISRPFYMAAYECRQREFYKLMMPKDYDYDAWKYVRGPLQDGAAWRHKWHGGQFGASTLEEYTYPMECVSWHRAMEFCRKLTEQDNKAGRLPEGYVYRLPTEAEWEYACRAGTEGPYNFEADYSKCHELNKHIYLGGGAWIHFGAGDSDSKRKPNAWGLYDMHGNVYEWCLDWYGPYEKGAQTDPVGSKVDSADSPRVGKEKVARGGGAVPWVYDGVLDNVTHPFLRSASRYSFEPDANYVVILGFRVVLAPEVADH